MKPGRGVGVNSRRYSMHVPQRDGWSKDSKWSTPMLSWEGGFRKEFDFVRRLPFFVSLGFLVSGNVSE